MPRERKLTEDFREYMRLIYPGGVGPAQQRDLYKCFHAGALCAIQAVLETVSDDKVSEDSVGEFVAALHSEAFKACRLEIWRGYRTPEPPNNPKKD